MENPEEVLHSLEEFAKLRPRNIPRELEEYLRFVARTGDPVYQWPVVKSLFREKLASVVAEFRDACSGIDVPPCPNVDPFNYESMRSFILERLDGFAAAPFTIQRICELLTSPRKEYNRIDKYMRALEKNILVVSTTEPGNRRRGQENGEGIVNGLESEHLSEPANADDINVEEMDIAPDLWLRIHKEGRFFQNPSTDFTSAPSVSNVDDFNVEKPNTTEETAEVGESVICRSTDEPFVSIEPVVTDTCLKEDNDVTVTITAIPAAVQKRRSSIEPAPSEETEEAESVPETKTDSVESSQAAEEVEVATRELSVITKEDKLEADNVPTEQIESTQEPEISSSKEEETEKAIIEVLKENIDVKMEESNEVVESTAEEPIDESKDVVSDLKTDLFKSESESDSQSSSSEFSSSENSLQEEPQPQVENLENQVTSTETNDDGAASQSNMEVESEGPSQSADI